MERSKRKAGAPARGAVYIAAALLALAIVALLAMGLGAVSLPWSAYGEIIGGQPLSKAGRILLYVRLPRVAAGILAGMALALAGAVIQTVLDNPLAGPNLIGVNSGAGVAVTLAGILLPGAYRLLPLAAFLGAFFACMLVFFLGKKTGSSRLTLILAGVGVNSLLGGIQDAIFTLNEASLISGNAFKIGGLAGVNGRLILPSALAIGGAAVAVYWFRNELELLSLGQERSAALGLPVEAYRLLFLALASILAGAAVSFAGLLGFVGLIIPHVARMLAGGEMAYFLPLSALLGGLFLLLCDMLARLAFAPFEIPVGIVLSFVGAPFFLWLLFVGRRRNRA